MRTQNENVDCVETNVEHATVVVEEARADVAQAIAYERRSGLTRCLVLALVAVIVGGVAGATIVFLLIR